MINIFLLIASVVMFVTMLFRCYQGNLWLAETESVIWGSTLCSIGIIAGSANFLVCTPHPHVAVAAVCLIALICVLFWALHTIYYLCVVAGGRRSSVDDNTARMMLLGIFGASLVALGASLLCTTMWPIGLLVSLLYLLGTYFAINEGIPLFKAGSKQ